MHKGGGDFYNSPLESSFSHFPENFVGYPSLYDNSSGNERFLHESDITIISQSGGGGGLHDFLQTFFFSWCETFVGETFSVSHFSGSEKFYSQEGYVTILFWKSSVS